MRVAGEEAVERADAASGDMTNEAWRCYQHLRNRIVRGELMPGVRIVAEEVASRLGVSRMPVREALVHLQRDGLVRTARKDVRAATIVAPLTVAEMSELYRIMGALEGAAMFGLAALEPRERQALSLQLERANRALEKEVGRQPRDFNAMFDRHDAFHRAFIDRLAGPRLRAMLATLRAAVDRYEWAYGRLVQDHAETFKEHAKIINAVRTGDPGRAAEAVTGNWSGSADRLSFWMKRLLAPTL